MAGYDKIKMTCQIALGQGFSYVWLDTCCIDKSSSAELSEAINSMFRWYEKAKVCYAYLDDVNCSSYEQDMPSARWFTRGWTLQELLAPNHVQFYSKDWQYFGEKTRLIPILERITKINSRALDKSTLGRFSVSERMSWMAARQTTKAEDLAYALLGIFDVHMPLLYGEGDRAFIRLQEEIMKHDDDQSLFAWTPPQMKWNAPISVLAEHPRQFIRARTLPPPSLDGEPYALTNKGIRIHLMLPRYTPTRRIGLQLYLAVLDIYIAKSGASYQPGIILHKLGGPGQRYCRIATTGLVFVGDEKLINTVRQTIYICHRIPDWKIASMKITLSNEVYQELERGDYVVEDPSSIGSTTYTKPLGGSYE